MTESWKDQDRYVVTIATTFGDEPHGGAQTVFFTSDQWQRLEKGDITFSEFLDYWYGSVVPPAWFPDGTLGSTAHEEARRPERRRLTLLVDIDHGKVDPPHFYESEDWVAAVAAHLERGEPAFRIVDVWAENADGATDASRPRHTEAGLLRS